jgi:Fe-S oxidoreductase
VAPRRIVATCRTAAHVEEVAFGGTFEVIHHTQLIQDLYANGKLKAAPLEALTGVTFHDPCYLGRQNGVFDAPRKALEQAGAPAAELPRHAAQSFCCGAGGAQMGRKRRRARATSGCGRRHRQELPRWPRAAPSAW